MGQKDILCGLLCDLGDLERAQRAGGSKKSLNREGREGREGREEREEKIFFCWPGGPRKKSFAVYFAILALLSERSERAVKNKE